MTRTADDPTSDTCEYRNLTPGTTSDTSVSGDSQGADSTSDITDLDHSDGEPTPQRRRGAAPTPVPDSYAAAFATYERGVSHPAEPLSPRTVHSYLSRVRQYLVWLEDATVSGTIEGDPLSDPVARDWALRDYRSYLQIVAKRSPSTVNAHLTAVDDFNRRVGPGKANAKRLELPTVAPRALEQRAQIRFLREAERAPARDRAIALTAFYAGLRIAELAALDVDDARLSARKGKLIVRSGKNNKYREVEMSAQLRAVLEDWLTTRGPVRDLEHTALFPNRRGGRLTTRALYDILTGLADAAGIREGFTPHVLRHTMGTNLRRQGEDIVIIAELLGHSIETARRYTLPTEDERQAAVDGLPTDA